MREIKIATVVAHAASMCDEAIKQLANMEAQAYTSFQVGGLFWLRRGEECRICLWVFIAETSFLYV